MKGEKTYYEWDIETLDEHGDVEDHHHADTLRELLPHFDRNDPRQVLVLVHNVWDECDGVIDRSWAYVNSNGTLPREFSSGLRQKDVPKRFHEELRKSSLNQGK